MTYATSSVALPALTAKQAGGPGEKEEADEGAAARLEASFAAEESAEWAITGVASEAPGLSGAEKTTDSPPPFLGSSFGSQGSGPHLRTPTLSHIGSPQDTPMPTPKLNLMHAARGASHTGAEGQPKSDPGLEGPDGALSPQRGAGAEEGEKERKGEGQDTPGAIGVGASDHVGERDPGGTKGGADDGGAVGAEGATSSGEARADDDAADTPVGSASSGAGSPAAAGGGSAREGDGEAPAEVQEGARGDEDSPASAKSIGGAPRVTEDGLRDAMSSAESADGRGSPTGDASADAGAGADEGSVSAAAGATGAGRWITSLASLLRRSGAEPPQEKEGQGEASANEDEEEGGRDREGAGRALASPAVEGPDAGKARGNTKSTEGGRSSTGEKMQREEMHREHDKSAGTHDASPAEASAPSTGAQASRIPEPSSVAVPGAGEPPSHAGLRAATKLKTPQDITPARFRILKGMSSGRPVGDSPARSAARQLDFELEELLGTSDVGYSPSVPAVAASASPLHRHLRRRDVSPGGRLPAPSAAWNSPEWLRGNAGATGAAKESGLGTPGDAEVGTVRVAARVRPLIGVETAKGAVEAVSTGTEPTGSFVLCGEGQGRMYHFSHVFGTQSSQEEVYERAVRHAVGGCAEGYNCTIVAYGQTGSGKTYTMGTGPEMALWDGSGEADQDPGVLPRALWQLFGDLEEKKEKEGLRYSAECRFIEIYNEDIRDLLSPSHGAPQAAWGSRGVPAGLPLQDNADGTVTVAGGTSVRVRSAEAAMRVFQHGIRNRTTGQTAMNERSSRSHALLSVHLRLSGASLGPSTALSSLRMVDLAGSERTRVATLQNARFKEAISINQGLLALGNVISALAFNSSEPRSFKHRHVPYR